MSPKVGRSRPERLTLSRRLTCRRGSTEREFRYAFSIPGSPRHEPHIPCRRGSDGCRRIEEPLLATVDLDRGETVEVRLPDGGKSTVNLLDIKETRDSLREAVRGADMTVELKGRGSFLKTSCVQFPLF